MPDVHGIAAVVRRHPRAVVAVVVASLSALWLSVPSAVPAAAAVLAVAAAAIWGTRVGAVVLAGSASLITAATSSGVLEPVTSTTAWRVLGWLQVLVATLIVGRLGGLGRELRRHLEAQQLASEQLRRERAALRHTVGSLPAVVWTTDRDLRYTSVDGSALASIGLRPEDVLGRRFPEVAGDSEQGLEARAAVGRALEGEHVRYTTVIAGRVFDSWVGPLVCPDGAVAGVVGADLDVTARAEAEARLAEALDHERSAADRLRELDGMKDEFLMAVSHELRTPVTAVRGFTHTLRSAHAKLRPEQVAVLVDRLDVAARRLDRVLDDILDVQRLDATSERLSCRMTSLHDIAARVVAEHDHEGRIGLVAEAVTASVDGPKVERLLDHLVANAVRYTSADTALVVRVERADRAAVLSVEQSGVGLPAEFRERIFEPFRRGDRMVSHSPGTGVGLTVVRGIAEAHGGTVTIDDLPDGGIAFRVSLPVAGVVARRAA